MFHNQLDDVDTAVRLLGTPATELLELLIDVELIRIARKARLTEEHAQGIQLRYRTNHLEVNVLFEASYQSPVVHDVQALASDLLLTKGMTQLHAPVHHTAEEQIQVTTAFFHAIHLLKELILLQCSWLKVDLLHIRRVDAKHTEARIKVLDSFVDSLKILLSLLTCSLIFNILPQLRIFVDILSDSESSKVG